jgi:leucyl-tRNA synthetase
MIHCEKCGIIPVAEKDLPVLLPENVKFGEGNPLATNQDFVNVNCPNCKGNAKRETDTMDTFFDSSWYYLRFTDAHNKKEPFAKKNVEYWMPVDFYVGGAEHACMHLIYARFFTKALRDLGYVSFGEPFRRLFNQGMIHGEDGAVMSKSRGNVIDPLTISSQYGADALRIFLMSVAGPDKDFAWSSTGVQSCLKFINKIYQYVVNAKNGKSSKKQQHKINLALKGITDDFEYIGYNLAIIKLRGLFDSLEEEISKEDVDKVILMLAPFCPHIAEELWEKTGHKGMIADASWPQVDESAINEEYEKMEKALETTVTDIMNLVKLVKEKQGKEIAKVYLYTIPPEKDNYNPVMLSERTGKEVAVFAVNDAKKYDPQGKATKAKPGRPAIYLE